MTKKVLMQVREIDAAAERAGGYVAAPGSLRGNTKGQREFSTIRQYSLQHRVSISKLTDDDYRKMGIKRAVN